MSTTKKKTKKTSKSMASRSKKRQPSSKTRSSNSRTTSFRQKSDSSQSVEALKNEICSSSTATGREKAERSSASFPPESLPRPKKDAWVGYDFENLPELTDEQLATFQPVGPEEARKLAGIAEIQITKDGAVVGRKKVGRPKKDPMAKENIVGIRLSRNMIERLKQLAQKAGDIGWQTYVKRVLEEHLDA